MLAKRAFFNKLFLKEATVITPPYFGGEFNCLSCSGLCVDACHLDLLSLENGIVKFDSNKRGCDFCEQCAIVCPNSVLNLENGAFINAKTSINSNECIAWDGVICYNCQDICKFNAITYFGMFRPVINDKCVNCAQCVSACHASAITLS